MSPGYAYVVRHGGKVYGPFLRIQEAEAWGQAQFLGDTFEVLVLINPDPEVQK